MVSLSNHEGAGYDAHAARSASPFDMLRVRRFGKIAVGLAPAATISGKASFLLAAAAVAMAKLI